jgi:hypothetical protein
LIFARDGAKKSWQNDAGYAIFVKVNATPNDNRKAALADARRALESAAHFTRGGGAPAPGHDADHASRAGRIEAEQRRLIQWAKENGKLGPGGRRPPVFAGGGEHNVFFQKRTQRYIKATRLDRHKGYGIALGSLTHGATPSEYLDRIALQNQIFEDDIRLELERLQRAGKRNLADRIEHVARTQGDHLGYDIQSFEEDGRDRLIEVKTTRFGALTPSSSLWKLARI